MYKQVDFAENIETTVTVRSYPFPMLVFSFSIS